MTQSMQSGQSMEPIEAYESEVRSYCRSFPVLVDRAEGSHLIAQDGRRYLDFWAGAGALNYGHNPPRLVEAVVDYLGRGGVLHSLDLATVAKARFLERFQQVVLAPRGMAYKVQFPGPTGTNAIEAALKLARKVTGRTNVIAFTNGFHGMTLGALATTGNLAKRAGASTPLGGVTRLPFDGYLGPQIDTLDLLDRLLTDPGSGVDAPAAVLLETIQAEGGVKVASPTWLRRLRELTRHHQIPLIVDDIQVGCGRTGPFFSFEEAGIDPDIVCLSKSISGLGLPLALVLIRPELDIWRPGEHNGTFRGNNLAFVSAAAALDYWEDDALTRQVEAHAAHVRERLERLAAQTGGHRRGRGLIQAIAWDRPGFAGQVSRAAFERGLVIETAGPRDEVLKLLPPLVIDRADLDQGLDLIEESVSAALDHAAGTPLGDPEPAVA